MQMQTEYDIERNATDRVSLSKAIRYVPPFLQVKANEIQSWADTLAARHELPVMLRVLVHSTCADLTQVNFPGNDDSQRHGWDGLIETSTGNSWIPSGLSGWEFGTNKNVTTKADEDYETRASKVTEQQRMATTFVFVSPRRWHKKESWQNDKRTEGKWKNVMALDASDLEQWIEQSIEAQIKFAEVSGRTLDGVKSLETCWNDWCADCTPKFTMGMFDEPVSNFREKLRNYLLSDSDQILRITGDSKLEGLAFLAACLLQEGTTREDKELSQIADKVVVFTKHDQLPKLAVGSPGFIPVIAHPDVELEFAQLKVKPRGCLMVDHHRQNAISSQPKVVLRPLTDNGFRDALESMSLGPDEIKRLKRESGRSLTVFRRRRARNEQLKLPQWSRQQDTARSLAAMALAGTWLKNNEADTLLLQNISQCDASSLEENFLRLLNTNETPVWEIVEHRGVVSKLDILYSIVPWLSTDVFRTFLEVAQNVLSERDPSLDLPDDQHWAAPIYGKVWKHSEPIRKGISESLVLLAVHGRNLFDNRVPEPEHEITELVRDLLEPMSIERLTSQSIHLPLYAEAAPETFLRIFERDLSQAEPVVYSLMKPATDTLFNRNERVHLLWALELLAWNPEWLIRVVEILARLAEREPVDNLSNKPSNSLLSIFRSWMPQTGASLGERKLALEDLIRKSPEVAWHILTEQFVLGNRFGEYSTKPLWRDYAIGLGEPVRHSEAGEFVRHCIDSCIDWKTHTAKTLADLTGKTEEFESNQLKRLESAVKEWKTSATDKDCSFLRERIRESLGIIRLRTGSGRIERKTADEKIDLLERLYEELNPRDLVWRHAWLFEKSWVPRSYEEEVESEKNDERIRTLQRNAILEVQAELGIRGVIGLAFCGNAPDVTGRVYVDAIEDLDAQTSLLTSVLTDASWLESHPHQMLVSGIFDGMGSEQAITVVGKLNGQLSPAAIVLLLCQIPFEPQVWTALDRFGEAISYQYWHEVKPVWRKHGTTDLNYVVSMLLAAERPYEAFDFAHLNWMQIESIYIQSILVDLQSSTEFRRLISRNDVYYIERAFRVLNERQALPQSEMARLEWLYLDFRLDGDYGIPNLEREIESKPELFCEFVALTSSRADGDTELTQSDYHNAQRASRLLGGLKRIPGLGENGSLNVESLKHWIHTVQIRSESLKCKENADYRIGEILSHAGTDDDGFWPCRPVCKVLNEVLNDDIESGFQIGRSNARGVHIRAYGGDPEREFAEQYDEWASKCSGEFPRVAATLRQLASSYRSEGRFWDHDAAIRERTEY